MPDNNSLTDTERGIIDAIVTCPTVPTQQAVADTLGYASANTIRYHVRRLTKRGWLAQGSYAAHCQLQLATPLPAPVTFPTRWCPACRGKLARARTTFDYTCSRCRQVFCIRPVES